jgi:hypothetical protein|tara:strand:+ start:155 stop:346 length:192 start_codon:yes stop_codon:yes gene_type:complete
VIFLLKLITLLLLAVVVQDKMLDPEHLEEVVLVVIEQPCRKELVVDNPLNLKSRYQPVLDHIQ